MKVANSYKRGFTLLEILVVISIIGILIAIGAVAFSTAQKKSRDARRHADMKQYQNAFEQYYSDGNTYSTSCSDMEAKFVGGAPVDPKTGSGYVKSCTATSYCVCALLDNLGTGNATNDNCSFGVGNYFCVKNLQ